MVRLSIVPVSQLAVRSYEFKCPNCKQDLTYAGRIPFRCPVCDRGIPDYAKLINKLPEKVAWHKSGVLF